MARARTSEWLESWDPESESWDSRMAWKTLWVTTFCLTLAFATWFLPSAFIPQLNSLGYDFTTAQLYWMAAMPGLSGGLLRILWTFLPPIMGTRRMVTYSTLLMIFATIGWGVRVQAPTAPYWELMVLAFLAGIGGGVFSGFMPSTSYFFPRRKQGLALGLQAGFGNFGVSLVQMLTPLLIGVGFLGFLGSSQTWTSGDEVREVWYQNAAFIWLPLLVVGAILAWTMLKSVPVKANFKQQLDIFRNQDTWWQTILYIMTFGTFSGLSAQFGLLMQDLYGRMNPEIYDLATNTVLVEGFDLRNPINFVFLGPLVGAGSRIIFAQLTDRMGGAIWTLVAGIGIGASIVFTMTGLTPDVTSAATLDAGFNRFLFGMLAIFFFTGIGNASTFKQMPMIFERRQAGGVIGWTAAIGAFGPFLFGIGITTIGPVGFYAVGVAWAVLCVVITWVRYARPGAPKPG
ncbi:major facilitator superfamily MFS_1 [Xylanimonas cellulosilytica DSM 15894]|uniref:Major facilitator superfamily MFS_1 n=1 Tax=Xylanimonas cellulosilytica (strain DSM 15894 / JCM 12276 / CECT 5975 / KCTC 9989 / LMG 20990 / NBRC 107835 / XIL07) TaxID=446471 RepID=D1BTT4_XYLCX|nr:MFS transporter [Xylanimonas cellulosilytica]ACZ31063.1 major facilitator superfamily MFS_1 [Xylanimonas cellulosilytica DSM 15894]